MKLARAGQGCFHKTWRERLCAGHLSCLACAVWLRSLTVAGVVWLNLAKLTQACAPLGRCRLRCARSSAQPPHLHTPSCSTSRLPTHDIDDTTWASPIDQANEQTSFTNIISFVCFVDRVPALCAPTSLLPMDLRMHLDQLRLLSVTLRLARHCPAAL